MTLTSIILIFLAAVFVGLIVYGVASIVPFLRAYRNWLAIAFFGGIILFALILPALDKSF